MLQIALCDDNALFLEELAGRVAAILQTKIKYTLTKCTSAAQLLALGPQDIVFLDIGMRDLDGMEAARRLRARGDSCRLVFLTAYPKYVFSAFDVQASYFLTKPPDPGKLRQVLLLLAKQAAGDSQRFIAVRQGTGLRRVPLADILYLEVFDRKIFLYTAEACYDFYGQLEHLEQEFPEDFFRCHRSFIVQLAQIARYDKQEIIMSNGARVPIAKRKYREFCTAFLHFLKKDGALL